MTSRDEELRQLSEDLFKARVSRHLYISDSTVENFIAEFEGGNFVYSSHLSGAIRMGVHSYVNPGCRLRHVTIGRYCSIADRVVLSPEQHSIRMVSSHPHMIVKSSAADASLKHAETKVGHDVWLGIGAVVMSGLTIGHGAVIGAASIVTTSVPPYAVVVGSPARVIRLRFPEKIVEQLLSLEWWNYSMSNLKPMDLTDIEGFIEHVQTMIAQGDLTPLGIQPARLRYSGRGRLDNFSSVVTTG